MKTYDEFLAEEYEKEDEFWKEVFEDMETDKIIDEIKNF